MYEKHHQEARWIHPTPIRYLENCVYMEKRSGVQNAKRPRPHTHALETRVCVVRSRARYNM